MSTLSSLWLFLLSVSFLPCKWAQTWPTCIPAPAWGQWRGEECAHLPGAITEPPFPDPSSPAPVAWSVSLSLGRLDSDVGGGARGHWAEILTRRLLAVAAGGKGQASLGLSFLIWKMGGIPLHFLLMSCSEEWWPLPLFCPYLAFR